MRIQHGVNPSAPARNVAQILGPTAKHPEREAPPDAPGGRPIPKGREEEAKLEEIEWARLAAPDAMGVFRSGTGTGEKKEGSEFEREKRHEDDPEEEYEGGSDSDDEFTGGMMPGHGEEERMGGKERWKVRYIVGKAVHREAMRERDALEKELEGVKRELKRSWEWKEQALDAVLRRDLG